MRILALFSLILWSWSVMGQVRFVVYYNDLAALIAAPVSPNTDIQRVAVVKYTGVIGDIDTGGVFYYDPASVLAVNGTTVLKPTNANGRWIRGNAPGGGAGGSTNNTPEWVNVTDAAYGALGDATTDNYAAFTNAVGSLGVTGGTVYVPPGDYKIVGTLVLTNNVSLIGGGVQSRWVNPTSSTILRFYTTNSEAIRLAASTNSNTDTVRIADLLIDGVNSSGTADGINMETPTTIAGVKHVKLENVVVRDFPRHQVRLATNVFDIRFVGCSFLNPNRVTGDDLVRLINPTQVTFDDCWMSQYTPAKWHVYGPAGGMRFFGGTIAPMASGTTGASGIYVENGSIHLYGTHIEGPSTNATGNVGISYFGRAGGVIMPDGISFVGTGVQVGLGGPDPADNLTIGPAIYGNNVRDVWVTAGGSRTNTVILPVGNPISGAAPVIQDDRLATDGLYEVARLDRSYLAPLTATGQLSLGRQPHVGLLRLHGGSAFSVLDPALNVQNNRLISWYDSAGGKTSGTFIGPDASDTFYIGSSNGATVWVDINRNVGIGGAPTTKFQVYGISTFGANSTIALYDTATAGVWQQTLKPYDFFDQGRGNSTMILNTNRTVDIYGGLTVRSNLIVDGAVAPDGTVFAVSAGSATFQTIGNGSITDLGFSKLTAGLNNNALTNGNQYLSASVKELQDYSESPTYSWDLDGKRSQVLFLTNNTTVSIANVPTATNVAEFFSLTISNTGAFTLAFTEPANGEWLGGEPVISAGQEIYVNAFWTGYRLALWSSVDGMTLAHFNTNQFNTNSATWPIALKDGVLTTNMTVSSNLTVTGGTTTVSNPAVRVTQTWNNAGTTMAGMVMHITDTASASGSLFLDLQTPPGTSVFNVRKDGTPFFNIWQAKSGNPSVYTSSGNLSTLFSAATLSINNASILNSEGAAILQLGADAAGVTDQTIKGPDRITSDGVGGNVTFGGGRNRGASAGGSLIFQTSPAAGAGVAGTLATALTIDSTGAVISASRFRLKNYTVATLPAGTQGDTAYVTDATAPTYLGALVGGGAVVTPVFYNGTAWVSY